MTMIKDYDVIGLGNTIIDLLVEVDEQKLLELDLKKGEFHLVDEQKSKELLERIHLSQCSIKTVPGGSSANTIRGIALLGGKTILYGKVGRDKHGEIYVQEMKEQGVNPRIIHHDSSATGNAITFITPDAERTFSVHLGAAINLGKNDLLEEDIRRGKILHIEGYLIEGPTRETVLYAINLAKKNNTLISIDLADPGVIRRNKVFLQDLTLHADIIFANETEAKEFTNYEEEQAAREMGKGNKIVVVKLGKKGSLICEKGVITKIDSYPANVVDTTGAGDCYAAGFLYALCQGWPLEKAGKLGSLFAAKVVEQTGVMIRDIDKNYLKREIVG
ncbi:MAG: adenosine kinase [Nanoarchaeota archaeon]